VTARSFIDFIVAPMFVEFGKLLPSLAPQFERNLKDNKAYWDDDAHVAGTEAAVAELTAEYAGAARV